ncbi:MAG: rod shape-determining protein MreC [Nitrospirae bacterium]|nr:rod shape-determining protein MreC [Nitrospirota bacterium]
MSKKHFRVFLVFLVVTVTMMVYQASKGPIMPLGFLMHPLNLLNDSIRQVSYRISASIENLTITQKEIEDMRNAIAFLRLQNQKLKEIELENERLKDLLSLKKRQQGLPVSASVIARGNDLWSHTLIIDKGRADSITKGMAVITVKGLAGKIHEVYDSYSSVLLITDKRFKAGVRLQAGRAEGIFSGSGGRHGIIQYISTVETVREEEVIVTSGLDSLFPPGLGIGYISGVFKSDRKLFQDIEVTLFVDTMKVEEVIVLR